MKIDNSLKPLDTFRGPTSTFRSECLDPCPYLRFSSAYQFVGVSSLGTLSPLHDHLNSQLDFASIYQNSTAVIAAVSCPSHTPLLQLFHYKQKKASFPAHGSAPGQRFAPEGRPRPLFLDGTLFMCNRDSVSLRLTHSLVSRALVPRATCIYSFACIHLVL